MTTFGYNSLVDTDNDAAIQHVANSLIKRFRLFDESVLMDMLADICWLAQTSEFADVIVQIESLLDSALSGYEQCAHCGGIVLLSDKHHEFPDLCWDCGDTEMMAMDGVADTG